MHEIRIGDTSWRPGMAETISMGDRGSVPPALVHHEISGLEVYLGKSIQIHYSRYPGCMYLKICTF